MAPTDWCARRQEAFEEIPGNRTEAFDVGSLLGSWVGLYAKRNRRIGNGRLLIEER